VTPNPALCEHFDVSRAQLFDIVRVTGTRTFSELIERHGRGRGCDICKPAVASILASLAGGHILDGEQAALQDTNDHFLANLQRNGTYSVVPRVAGGEDHARQADRARRSRPGFWSSTQKSPVASASTCSAPGSSSCR